MLPELKRFTISQLTFIQSEMWDAYSRVREILLLWHAGGGQSAQNVKDSTSILLEEIFVESEKLSRSMDSLVTTIRKSGSTPLSNNSAVAELQGVGKGCRRTT